MAEQITGELDEDKDIDPMLAAVRKVIVDTQVRADNGADLTEFTAKNVMVIPPEATESAIDKAIQKAAAKSKGLALLIIGGSAKNPDTDAPGPQAVIDLELQLYVHPALRKAGSKSPLELTVALMRGLHDARIQVTGFPWYEEIRWLGYDTLADDDFTAYSISYERQMGF